ncbi:hypothetical protein KJ652_00880, partial [Patescibacteria group bacterium]|nr:hypothetical protein [Patescibacteria group bacterium]
MQHLRSYLKAWYYVKIKVNVGHVAENYGDPRDDKTFTYTTLADKLSQDIANAEDEEAPEENPNQPGVASAEEVIAGLQRVIDVGVEGLKFESMQPQELGTIDGELDGTEEVRLLANKIAQITFTITQDSMVNLWVNQSDITSTELFVK